MLTTEGIHHVTAIAADPQRNVDFYEGFLGQRFIKKTVNFDDPSAYHLYYGDYVGTPGTAMTFFSWQGMTPGAAGAGEANAAYYRILSTSIDFWRSRAEAFNVPLVEKKLFGEIAFYLCDPDGHHIYLVASEQESTPELQLWSDAPVPIEHSLQGFYGVKLQVLQEEMLAPMLVEGFGYKRMGSEGGLVRYALDTSHGSIIDIEVAPGESSARQGVGSIHHIALRARDDAEREEFRDRLISLGLNPTGLVDRTFFHSSYVWTPAGILFEIATDQPGFTINEPADSLGESLVLPEHYEHLRPQIEANLPTITLPRHD